MKVFQVVVDTNVLVAALRSKRGASFRLLMLIGDARWQLNLSVPLLTLDDKANNQLVALGVNTPAVH